MIGFNIPHASNSENRYLSYLIITLMFWESHGTSLPGPLPWLGTKLEVMFSSAFNLPI